VNGRREAIGRRFARLVTRIVVARPGLWRVFRRPLRAEFERLAPRWDEVIGPERLAPLAAALDRLQPEPGEVLDLGTGTGKAARLAAERFPEADVVGVDLAPAMIEQARALLPAELAGRVRFDVADASKLPFQDGAFDLVVLLNMIPFFEELARVTAPGGTAVFVAVSGSSTPIWTPPETLRARLEPLGFADFEELEEGAGTAFLARRAEPG
jgi:ubiquinone/menaquinone biosynthesis C-methylase UbiE